MKKITRIFSLLVLVLALCLFLLKLHFYQLRVGKVTIVRLGKATVSAGIVCPGMAQGVTP